MLSHSVLAVEVHRHRPTSRLCGPGAWVAFAAKAQRAEPRVRGRIDDAPVAHPLPDADIHTVKARSGGLRYSRTDRTVVGRDELDLHRCSRATHRGTLDPIGGSRDRSHAQLAGVRSHLRCLNAPPCFSCAVEVGRDATACPGGVPHARVRLTAKPPRRRCLGTQPASTVVDDALAESLADTHRHAEWRRIAGLPIRRPALHEGDPYRADEAPHGDTLDPSARLHSASDAQLTRVGTQLHSVERAKGLALVPVTECAWPQHRRHRQGGDAQNDAAPGAATANALRGPRVHEPARTQVGTPLVPLIAVSPTSNRFDLVQKWLSKSACRMRHHLHDCTPESRPPGHLGTWARSVTHAHSVLAIEVHRYRPTSRLGGPGAWVAFAAKAKRAELRLQERIDDAPVAHPLPDADLHTVKERFGGPCFSRPDRIVVGRDERDSHSSSCPTHRGTLDPIAASRDPSHA